MFSPTEQAIIKTLVWFDLRQQPLTLFECWKWLYVNNKFLTKISLAQVKSALISLQQKNQVICFSGFWQLKNSPTYYQIRLQRARLAIYKYKRARAGARLISFLPFVRMVAVVGSVARGTCQTKSDIDLSIVAQKNRLFIARFFVILLIHGLGWRRHHSKVANRLCLSFYVSTQALNFESLENTNGPYLEYALVGTLFLRGQKTYFRWLRANKWMQTILPNWWQLSVDYQVGLKTNEIIIKCAQTAWEIVLYPVAPLLEIILRFIQLRRIYNYLQHQLNHNTKAVIVNFNVLKFYQSHRCEALNQQYFLKLKSLGI